MGMLTGGFFSQGAGGGLDFAPTILGRQVSNGILSNVYAEDEDKKSTPHADATSDLWVITTVSEVEVRINTFANGNNDEIEQWWDDASVLQGIPGPTELVFQLGERTDVTFNFFTENVVTNAEITHTKLLSNFTDDDKISFVTPTNAVRYGYTYDTDNEAGAANVGTVTYGITFRKTGFNDYTIRFKQDIESVAID